MCDFFEAVNNMLRVMLYSQHYLRIALLHHIEDGMKFCIRLAEQSFEVNALYQRVGSLCYDYIIQNDSNEQLPEITITADDILKVSGKTEIEGKRLGSISRELWLNAAYYEMLAVQLKIAEKMPQYDTILMHGAVVATNGKAYMFTAPSGVGKTTRLMLWMKEYPDSFVVNGDKPFVKIKETEAIVYGSPWCGTEGMNTNISVPLKAIYILERAEDGNDEIKEISIGEAFPYILQQTYHPQESESFIKTLHLLKALNKKVKIYRFHSTPTRKSIRMAYEKANASCNND